MNNKQLADTFTLIANLLEIKGEIIYKTLAYRKASESLVSLPRKLSHRNVRKTLRRACRRSNAPIGVTPV